MVYMFALTVLVEHNGIPVSCVVQRGCKAECEEDARRRILSDMLAEGFQIRRMDRA